MRAVDGQESCAYTSNNGNERGGEPVDPTIKKCCLDRGLGWSSKQLDLQRLGTNRSQKSEASHRLRRKANSDHPCGYNRQSLTLKRCRPRNRLQQEATHTEHEQNRQGQGHGSELLRWEEHTSELQSHHDLVC